MYVLEVTRLHALTRSIEQAIVMSVPYIFHTAMLKDGILCGIMIVKVIITIMRRTKLKTQAFYCQIPECFFKRDKNKVCHEPKYRVQLTIRFNVSICLSLCWSHMTSNVMRTKKLHTKCSRVCYCVTDVLTTLWRLLWLVIEHTHGNMESNCFME